MKQEFARIDTLKSALSRPLERIVRIKGVPPTRLTEDPLSDHASLTEVLLEMGFADWEIEKLVKKP